MQWKGSHLLSITQFGDLDELATLFGTAEKMQVYARRERITQVLEGAVMASLFFEPSTRTRLSFEAAFNRLGGRVISTTGFTFSSLMKGESLEDTSRVISGYADVMVMRHPEVGSVARFASSATVPVINGGDGTGEHPTQALLDLYTLTRERQGLDSLHGMTVAMVGDLRYGRTVHSLSRLLMLFDRVRFELVSPDALKMPSALVAELRAAGHEVNETEDMESVLPGADVVYMTRIQEERFASESEYHSHRGRYALNRKLFDAKARPDATILHPLPRDSRPGSNELDVDLDDHPRLAIFRQSDNGIALRMALFALVMNVSDKVHALSEPTPWSRVETTSRDESALPRDDTA